MKYIEIDKKDIPYKFSIKLNKETFEFEVNYNNAYDFFTLDLYKNGEVVVLGEKLLYGKTLFTDVKYKNIPRVKIIPFSTNDDVDSISYENINDTVFLYVSDYNAVD